MKEENGERKKMREKDQKLEMSKTWKRREEEE